MLKRNRRTVSGLVGLTLAALLALPGAVRGDTSGPIAQTGGMTAELPLLGAPLTVAVTLDTTGNISNVDLNPVGEFAATRVGPHAVSFATTDGTVKVKIRAKGNSMSMKAAASSLDSLLGSGTWSTDMFGTGELTNVAYTVGAAADGTPTLSIDSVAALPAGVTVGQKPVENKSGKHGSSASAWISFSFEGYTKHLLVKVSVRDEGDRPASLTFQLYGKDRQKLTGSLEELVGPHSWSGFLCDGTVATVNYSVNADGSVSFVDATPAATPKDGKHGFRVRFDDTRTKVSVSLFQKEDESWVLKVEGKADRCRGTDVAAPTVSTPTAPDAEVSDHHGWSKDDADSDRGGSGRHGDSDHGGGSGRHGGDSGNGGDSGRHVGGDQGDRGSRDH